MSSRDELVEFDRNRIQQLLLLLDARLKKRGVGASVYLVGGAAIALSVHDSRRTRDVDAIVSNQAVIGEAAAVADSEHLPRSWLNQAARPWIPARPGSAMADPVEPGLIVHVAPAEHLLAMKLVSMRRQDVPDVVSLATELNMASVDADAFAQLLFRVYEGEDALQQVLGVPHDDVEVEARRRGEAAVRLIARASA